jgi:hypothetical protein
MTSARSAKEGVGVAEAWASLLGRLRRAYAAAGLDCGDKLRPPAGQTAARDLARRLGIPVPPSLRAVWRVHGGQGYVSPGVTGLFGKHRLHSPAEAAKSYRLFQKYNFDPSEVFPPPDGKIGHFFHPRLLPFASWDKYNLCVDTASGAVWEFSPNYGTPGGTCRPSLRALVEELLALLAAGRAPEPDFICPRPAIDPRWRTADVLGLVRRIAADGTLTRLPILADALK